MIHLQDLAPGIILKDIRQEAYRIRLAYLFDSLMAVHTSMVDPLPHQITAFNQPIQQQAIARR